MSIIHERGVDRTGAPESNTGIAFARIHRLFHKQHDPGELQLHCAGDAVRWPFKITGLKKFLAGLLILAVLGTTVQAVQSVTLAWDQSTDPNVAGYNVYYGVACHTYTNIIDVGKATNATISGLAEGTTYYFAATAYNTLGLESDYSGEVAFSVPTPLPPSPPTNVFLTINLFGPGQIQLQAKVCPTTPTTILYQNMLGLPWNVLATNVTADAYGNFSYVDSTTNSPMRFYRALLQ